MYTVAQWSENSFITAGGDGVLLLWNINDFENPVAIARTGSQIFSLKKISITRLLIGDIHGQVFLVDTREKRIIAQKNAAAGAVFDFEVTNNQKIISAHQKGKIIIWDGALNLIQTIDTSSKSIRNLQIVEPRILFAAGSEGKIFKIDLVTGKLVHEIPVSANSIFSFSKISENHFVAGGREAKLFEIKNDSVTEICNAHLGTINCLIAPENEKWLASAGRDREIRIWSKTDYTLLKVLNRVRDGGHSASVNKILFMDQHQLLISVGDDKQVIVWKINSV